MFILRSTSQSLSWNYVLSLPSPKTTPYYLHSFSNMASKLLNSLPDSFRTPNCSDFSRKILQYGSFQQFKVLECCNFTILVVFRTILVTRRYQLIFSYSNFEKVYMCTHVQRFQLKYTLRFSLYRTENTVSGFHKNAHDRLSNGFHFPTVYQWIDS